MLVLFKFWFFFFLLISSSFFGLLIFGWFCFVIMWLLQVMVFWYGMNVIKCFIDIVGLVVYVVMLVLVGWIVYKIGLDGIFFIFVSKFFSVGEQIWQMIIVMVLVVFYFFGLLFNFGDFFCYGKSMGEICCGNCWGLLFNFLLFLVVIVVIVFGIQLLFGKMIIDLIEIVSCVGNDLVVVIGLLIMIIVIIGINIVVNFVLLVFDFFNCVLQKISFCVGGMIVVVGLIFLMLWNLFNLLELIYYIFDVLGVFIGLLFGILIVDFYLIKCGWVLVDDLFDDMLKGKYWYCNGFNLKVIVVLLLLVGLGLIISFILVLYEVVNFSWFIGVFFGVIIYCWLVCDECEVQVKVVFCFGVVV